ncbi:peptidase A4 family-domain-containing protein, partial [Amanita rubescens]
MLTVPALVVFLYIVSAFAVPSLVKRRAGHRRSQPLQSIEATEIGNDTSQIQYSYNWAGAVWNKPPGTFKSVTGTFTVSAPHAPDGSASIWVGIDGNTCPGAILQTGIDVHYAGGAISYNAWYEWYPDVSHFFEGIVIKTGDVIRLKVVAMSPTRGTATISNLSNNQVVSIDLTSSSALCGQNAEWIVEDYFQGNVHSLVPLCNFGTVKFGHASASGASGATVTPEGATLIDLVKNNRTLTSASPTVGGITIRY